jgi:CBS domain-containing protein
MVLPLIDSDPTALGGMPQGNRITRSTSVAEALAHLRLTGERAGVVYSQAVPTGIVTTAALHGAMAEGACDAPVAAVTDFVAVPIQPGADAETTLRAFNRAAWDWLRSR